MVLMGKIPSFNKIYLFFFLIFYQKKKSQKLMNVEKDEQTTYISTSTIYSNKNSPVKGWGGLS